MYIQTTNIQMISIHLFIGRSVARVATAGAEVSTVASNGPGRVPELLVEGFRFRV